MACNCNYLLYFVWLFIVKTDKHLLLLWLCITQYHCIMIVQQKNNRTSILPKVLVTQLCLTLCDPMGYRRPPDPSVHGIQARMEWVAIPFSRGSSPPRNQTWVSWISGDFFTNWSTREAQTIKISPISKYHPNQDLIEKPVITF